MVFEVIQWHASPGQALHVQDKSSGNSQHVFRKCLVGWPCPWLGSHPDNCWHIVWKSRLTTWHDYHKEIKVLLTTTSITASGWNLWIVQHHGCERRAATISAVKKMLHSKADSEWASGSSALWRRSTRTTARTWPSCSSISEGEMHGKYSFILLAIRDCAAYVKELHWLHLFSIRIIDRNFTLIIYFKKLEHVLLFRFLTP